MFNGVKAQTKTDEIHGYYIKLEELIQEFIYKYDCIKNYILVIKH